MLPELRKWETEVRNCGKSPRGSHEIGLGSPIPLSEEKLSLQDNWRLRKHLLRSFGQGGRVDSSEAGKLVGYKRPPKDSQFKKGFSGNPKGRPKGVRNLRTEFIEELNETVPVTLGGKSQLISKQRIAIKALVAQAMKGNISAASKVFEFWQKTASLEEPTENDDELSVSDSEILAAFIKGRGGEL